MLEQIESLHRTFMPNQDKLSSISKISFVVAPNESLSVRTCCIVGASVGHINDSWSEEHSLSS